MIDTANELDQTIKAVVLKHAFFILFIVNDLFNPTPSRSDTLVYKQNNGALEDNPIKPNYEKISSIGCPSTGILDLGKKTKAYVEKESRGDPTRPIKTYVYRHDSNYVKFIMARNKKQTTETHIDIKNIPKEFEKIFHYRYNEISENPSSTRIEYRPAYDGQIRTNTVTYSLHYAANYTLYELEDQNLVSITWACLED